MLTPLQCGFISPLSIFPFDFHFQRAGNENRLAKASVVRAKSGKRKVKLPYVHETSGVVSLRRLSWEFHHLEVQKTLSGSKALQHLKLRREQLHVSVMMTDSAPSLTRLWVADLIAFWQGAAAQTCHVNTGCLGVIPDFSSEIFI